MLHVDRTCCAAAQKVVVSVALLFISLVSMGLQSCKSDVKEAARRVEYTQIVERKSAVDAMNELYIAADGDVEALARMLQATPSVINRIRQGETRPTQDFEEKYKEALTYFYVNGSSFSKLRSALDDEYGWYDSILYFPQHHPWWFWGVTIVIVLALTLPLRVLDFVQLYATLLPIAEILIFLIAWIAMLIDTPDAMVDKFVEGINPILEQLL